MRQTSTPVLAVDLDGVVVHPLDRFGEHSWSHFLADDLGIEPQTLGRRFFQAHWPEIIVGRRDLREVLTEVLPAMNPQVSVQQLMDYWFTNESRLDQAVIEQLRSWKQRTGGRLVAMTNQERYRMAYLTENLGLGNIFESFVWSGDVGATKAEGAFFAAALTRIGLNSPASLIFIDDDQGNIDTARAAGWPAHPYTGINELRILLSDRCHHAITATDS